MIAEVTILTYARFFITRNVQKWSQIATEIHISSTWVLCYTDWIVYEVCKKCRNVPATCMDSCVTSVIHVWCLRCIKCIAVTCVIHMFYTCNTCVGYTPVLQMSFYTCNTLYYMCQTCVLQVFYRCITGIWITCVIHVHLKHMYLTCVSHMCITCVSYM